MWQLNASVKTVLYAVFALMLGAFATLGVLSEVAIRDLKGYLAGASASTEAIGGLRQVEAATDAFLRADDADVGAGGPHLARLRELLSDKHRALLDLAAEITLPDERERLTEAATAMVLLDERIRAIAGSRPILNSAKTRVTETASQIVALVHETNRESAEIALNFQADRAVFEGPFHRLSRMGAALARVEARLEAIGAEIAARRLGDAAAEVEIAAAERDLSRLRFATPLGARAEQAALSENVAPLLSEIRAAREAGGGLSAGRARALRAALAQARAAGERLRAAAVALLPPAAAGLAEAAQTDKNIDWAKLELGRAAVNSGALSIAARRVVEHPSQEAAESFRRALAAVLTRMGAAANAAPSFALLAERYRSADAIAEGVDAAAGTVIALSRDAERLRQATAQLVQGVEAAVARSVERVESEASARAQTTSLAVALTLGLLAWLVGLFIARNRLLLPLRNLTGSVERLAKGDLHVVCEGGGRRDEIGAMARALEVFRANALAVRDLSAAREEQERAKREQIEALLQGIEVLSVADDITLMFDGVLNTLARLVEFDEAVILVESPSGALATVACAHKGFRIDFAPPDPDGEDGAAEGEGAAEPAAQTGLAARLESLTQLDDAHWTLSGPIKELGFGSALLAPLATRSRRAMMICMRREEAVYGDGDLSAVRAFAPIAEQAVRNAEQLNELEGAVRELDVMAHQDALTGLHNRQAFINAIAERKRQLTAGEDQPFALLHIDLDHFKQINDAVGHAAGDYALVWAAGRIQTSVRESDMVARLGGDEFAVICDDDFDNGALMAMAQTLVARLSEPFEYEGKTLKMGASIGIGRYPLDSDDPEQMLHIADMALLEAKDAGRGRCAFFGATLRREIERRESLEEALRDATAANALVMRYQPIVDLAAGRVVAFEAQWRCKGALLSSARPEELRAAAERAGLLAEIGAWSVRQVCQDLAAWLQEDDARRVALDVSGPLLGAPDFLGSLEAILTEHALGPEALELELNAEFAMRRSSELASDAMGALHERGYRICFEQFGAGFAALGQLRRFPGQRVKLHPSLVSGAESDPAAAPDGPLIQGVLALARSLDLSVVADGVASAAQSDYCRAAGCAEGQGAYFGD
ncbi:MAG: EAL domain-containing protein, partial [Pseudomonadota bacterium]